MTVSKLIAELQKIDPETKVFAKFETVEYGHICNTSAPVNGIFESFACGDKLTNAEWREEWKGLTRQTLANEKAIVFDTTN